MISWFGWMDVNASTCLSRAMSLLVSPKEAHQNAYDVLVRESTGSLHLNSGTFNEPCFSLTQYYILTIPKKIWIHINMPKINRVITNSVFAYTKMITPWWLLSELYCNLIVVLLLGASTLIIWLFINVYHDSHCLDLNSISISIPCDPFSLFGAANGIFWRNYSWYHGCWCTGGRFKNTYELLNLRALKLSPVDRSHRFKSP